MEYPEIDYSGISIHERQDGSWYVPFTNGRSVFVVPGEVDGELQRFTTQLDGVAVPAVVAISKGPLDYRVAEAAKSRIISGH
ncbi:hypothetical protein [Nocardia jiangxiensis]|uniref:hypothetical protein n=1 Tax=Nocardia jiangxiensis TaxID=282685 RepID=UPI0003101A4D|nr:hypothetical protein [Nocardia jiangxiensis]